MAITSAARGYILVSLVRDYRSVNSPNGIVIPIYEGRDKNFYVEAVPGLEYTVLVENLSPVGETTGLRGRIEVVGTVDGGSILTGEKASILNLNGCILDSAKLVLPGYIYRVSLPYEFDRIDYGTITLAYYRELNAPPENDDVVPFIRATDEPEAVIRIYARSHWWLVMEGILSDTPESSNHCDEDDYPPATINDGYIFP